MSQDAHDRVGARPISAFSTAEIVGEPDEDEASSISPQHSASATIGITPLSLNHTPVLSDDTEDELITDHSVNEENQDSILLAQDDHVFGLLRDPHADPPIETHGGGDSSVAGDSALFASSSPPPPQQETNQESSDDEYHSPLEDNDNEEEASKPKPIMNASPYEFDVNFNMVGHLQQPEELRQEEQQQSQSQQQEQHVLNTSLADAAAASMIASTTAAAAATSVSPPTTSAEEQTPPAPPIPTQQPFSFRRSTSAGRRSNPYRYQKYTASSQSEEDEDDLDMTPSAEEQEMPTHTTTTDTVVSEMNESTSASTSSSSAGATPATTRARRRRHGRASSFSHSSPTRQATSGATPQHQHNETPAPSSRTSSLDSGMAAVRRWIRARASGGSSRAARRWQREQSLQLGEEDLFALTHAGEDPRRSSDFFPSILEEEETSGFPIRQRALSEPNNIRMRNFFFQRAAHGPPSSISSGGRSYRQQQARRSTTSESLDDDGASSRSGSAMSTSISVPTHLSSAALNSSLFHSPQRGAAGGSGDLSSVNDEVGDGGEPRGMLNDGDVSSLAETSVVPPSTTAPAAETQDDDPNREARTRWIRINRRFQLIITVVALIFSLLLFAILVCWVVFTSAYVISIDKTCDVPLKQYFWLATLQLILDVFRTDIMRFIFRWDTHSNDRIPIRVIMYNIAYLIYALLVLRMGVKSVFRTDDSTCPSTAPELYQSSAAFVSLSIAAWSTIVLGYLVPFCFVATLLTWNGYSPTAENPEQNAGPVFVGGVFPAAYSTTGAPPGCVDQLRTVLLEEFPDDYPRECCICMGDFVTGEVIVATECQHVFHKRCCEEWLRHARTCPVCRMDIPSSLPGSEEQEAVPQPPPPTSRLTSPFPGREDLHQDVVGLLQILRRQESRLRQRNASSDDATGGETSSSQHDGSPTSAALRSESLPVGSSRDTEMVSLEEGRVNRQHSR